MLGMSSNRWNAMPSLGYVIEEITLSSDDEKEIEIISDLGGRSDSHLSNSKRENNVYKLRPIDFVVKIERTTVTTVPDDELMTNASPDLNRVRNGPSSSSSQPPPPSLMSPSSFQSSDFVVKIEIDTTVITVPDDEPVAAKKSKLSVPVPYDSTSKASPDLNRVKNGPSSSSSQPPPPSLMSPSSFQSRNSCQNSPITDAGLRQLLDWHKKINPTRLLPQELHKVNCKSQTPEEETIFHPIEIKESEGHVKIEPDNCDITTGTDHFDITTGTDHFDITTGTDHFDITTGTDITTVITTDITKDHLDVTMRTDHLDVTMRTDHLDGTDHLDVTMRTDNRDISNGTSNVVCGSRVNRRSNLSRNIFQQFNASDMEVSINTGGNGYVYSVGRSLPFCLRYCPVLPRSSVACDFNEGIENSMGTIAGVTCEINATIKGIAAFTSKTFRPPRRLIAKLFHWMIDSTSESELNMRLSVMRQIHRLHGFPNSEPLWVYVEKAYDRDSFERTSLTLLIKSCVLDFICFILEADFHASEKVFDKFAEKTRAYKLLSVKENFGNIKTIIAWLEDTIKLYDEYCNSLQEKHAHHLNLVIKSLQKLLAFSICVSGVSKSELKSCANDIAREIGFAHNRLDSFVQQRLIITGIKSNVLLMITVEKLLQQIPMENDLNSVNEEYCYSSCNWEKILNYYFKIFSFSNIQKWNQTDLLRNTFYMLLLLQCYIEGSQSTGQLHDVPRIVDELAEFQMRVETVFLNNVPDELEFMFSFIKLSMTL